MSFPNPATQFRPGEEWRGNPGGRPKGRSLTALIREVLDSNTIKGKPLPEGRTVADVLAEVFVAEALKGKFPFAKEVIDRTDGKLASSIEVSGPSDRNDDDLDTLRRLTSTLRDRRRTQDPPENPGQAVSGGVRDGGESGPMGDASASGTAQ